MKAKLLLGLLLTLTIKSKSQVILNEVYSDPGAGKQEFFELYNTGYTSESMNNYTLVTFFNISGSTGFYVLDLPNLNVAQKGYFVGSAAIPFSYQGVSNSTASDFSWNDIASLSANNGYLKKWVKSPANLLDGNPNYDEAPVPLNFNDLFYRYVGVGASYTVFLYKNGVLANAVIFGTGGLATVIPTIIAMPDLFIDMSGASTDFTIKFSNYGSIPIENVIQDAGSDNGFIRKADGQCGSWDKSSAQVQHTPKQTNGYLSTSYGNTVSLSSNVFRGTAATGSKVYYDVVAAPSTSFPITIDVYTDMGAIPFKIDASDPYVASNTENVVTDGPFNTVFFPFAANVLLVVKTNVGCIDKAIFVPNAPLLPVRLISFAGNKNNGHVSLQWSVASNEGVAKIDIEESADGKSFSNKATVVATSKNGDENYNYTGISETDKVYYRLRITEKSGVVTYSKVLVFNDELTRSNFTILGNTTTDRLTISYQTQSNQAANMNILDMNGRVVLKQTLQAQKGNNVANISLPSSMTSGMYLAVFTADNTNSSAKFMKQ